MYLASNTADKQTRPTSCRISIPVSVLPAVLLLSSERQIQRCVISGFHPEVRVTENTLLRVITQRVMVISYRRFGTTCRSHPQSSKIQRSSGFKNPTIFRVQESNDSQGSRIQRSSGFKNPTILRVQESNDPQGSRIQRSSGFKNPAILTVQESNDPQVSSIQRSSGFKNPTIPRFQASNDPQDSRIQRSSRFKNPTTPRFQESNDPQGSQNQDSWTLRMGPIGCPETSVINYQYSLFSNPEDSSSQI